MRKKEIVRGNIQSVECSCTHTRAGSKLSLSRWAFDSNVSVVLCRIVPFIRVGSHGAARGRLASDSGNVRGAG